ncbi:MAG: hypothetical protein OXE04_02810 [bacterium]|nr:hypothetical protein [bacterium]MCY4257205.1 hypothetical protein [bacterium]
MENSSDIVNLIIALATAVPALVAAVVGIVKANHAQRQIAVIQQNNQQTSTQLQANALSSEASGVGKLIFNIGQLDGERNE